MRYAKLRGARSGEKQRFATVSSGAIQSEPDCISREITQWRWVFPAHLSRSNYLSKPFTNT